MEGGSQYENTAVGTPSIRELSISRGVDSVAEHRILPRYGGEMRAMKSAIIKHSVLIGRHKTSVSLEEPFWKAVRDIAAERQETISHLVAAIDADRREGNLSSAIRLFVLGFYQSQLQDERQTRSYTEP
jgi:predicted DNA-binding ribbon-helix-helix protein